MPLIEGDLVFAEYRVLRLEQRPSWLESFKSGVPLK